MNKPEYFDNTGIDTEISTPIWQRNKTLFLRKAGLVGEG